MKTDAYGNAVCESGSSRPLLEQFPPKLSDEVPCCPDGSEYDEVKETCVDESGNDFDFTTPNLDGSGGNLLDQINNNDTEDDVDKTWLYLGISLLVHHF